MAKSHTVLRPMPIHRRRDFQQMTQKCKSYIASVTVPPPASSHLPGLCCSCRFCHCKPREVVCHIWPKDWNWAEEAEAGTPHLAWGPSQSPVLGTILPHVQAATQQPPNESVLRVSTQRRWASLVVPSLPLPQRDGQSGDGTSPTIATLKPK